MPRGARVPFAADTIAAASGPLVHVELGDDGRPVAARASVRIASPPDRVWAAVSDVSSYAARVPMIDRARLRGDRVSMDLKFRISLFAVGFAFEAREVHEDGRFIELSHLAGEPRGLNIRFDLEPHDDARATLLTSRVGFDITSLGWLVKFFLKHHPEIQYGVYPGCALALLDAMKRTAEEG